MDMLVTGNTFNAKAQLKELGGKWSPAQNGWVVPADKRAEVENLASETKGLKVFDARSLRVEGKAYDAREELKALGGRWSEQIKAWVAPIGAREAIEKLGLTAVEIDTPGQAPAKGREPKLPSPMESAQEPAHQR